MNTDTFPVTKDGLERLLAYLIREPSREGYDFLFDHFGEMLDKSTRKWVKKQLREQALLDCYDDPTDLNTEELELLFATAYPETTQAAYEMCEFLQQYELCEPAWDYFEDHLIDFLPARDRARMRSFKDTLFKPLPVDPTLFDDSPLDLDSEADWDELLEEESSVNEEPEEVGQDIS